MIAAPGFAPVSGSGRLKVGLDANPPLNIVLARSGSALGTLSGMTARDIQADLVTAETLFNLERWDEAIAAYKAMLLKAPVLSRINLQIALAQRRKGDATAAITTYEELLKVDSTNEKARIGIALAHAERGDRKTAEELLLKTAENPDAGREVFFSLGEFHDADGRGAEAVKWYRRASEVDASWGKPLYKLGMSAAKRGETAAAREFLTKALTVDPLSPEAALAKNAVDQLSR
jgi:Tfp pilus assembly protein PilF